MTRIKEQLMKRFFLALCISLFMPFVSLAQSYVRGSVQNATWTTSTLSGTSAVAGNGILSVDMTKSNYTGVIVSVAGGASLTGGAFTFEAGKDSTHTSAVFLTRQSSTGVESTYSFGASTNENWVGASLQPYFQVRLLTSITASAGNGSTTVTLTPIVGPSNQNSSVVFTGTDTPCYLKSGTGSVADTTNHANCKNSSAVFKGGRAINTSTTIACLKLYNLATDPTLSSGTGFIESIPIPPASASGGANGIVDVLSNFSYATGLSYGVTGFTGGACSSTENSAPPAGVFVTLSYN